MNHDERMRLFALGHDVVFVLPHNSSALRPSRKDIRVAAEILKISEAKARRALDFYNFEVPND
jgi:hypothetical protein